MADISNKRSQYRNQLVYLRARPHRMRHRQTASGRSIVRAMKGYIDLRFYQMLQDRFKAPGDSLRLRDAHELGIISRSW